MPPRRRSCLKPAHQSILLWHVLVFAWYLRNYLGDCAQNGRLVDLTHTFDEDTIYWITEPNLRLNVTHNGTAPGQDFWYQKDEFSAATHGGTHLDAPSHFAKGRWSVSDIPLSNLVGPMSVVDISRHVLDNPDRHLTLDDVLEWERVHGPLPEDGVLMVRTGWSRFWPDKKMYSGTDKVKDVAGLRFPSIQPEVADWLIRNRKLVGVGIDTMSVDVPNTRPSVHVTLMEQNIYGLENVNNLDLLPESGAVVYVMPMKLRYASGAPCRIVAQIDQGGHSASFALCVSPNYLILLMTVLLAVYWLGHEMVGILKDAI
ncbi:hypothetical protein JTE90_009801 [Oedothorax gibbosus]|uniref:Kynurenine formamidase n=1 Tax=Oedothorax gibbosus TaxID=931172 RepID=A0AAV6UR05_9ARAC|nr:hypothetical protein JTE90_009801 [Oedothorax gibbosus]